MRARMTLTLKVPFQLSDASDTLLSTALGESDGLAVHGLSKEEMLHDAADERGRLFNDRNILEHDEETGHENNMLCEEPKNASQRSAFLPGWNYSSTSS